MSTGHGTPPMLIRFSTADSSLGKLIVATTGRGIRALELGDSDDALGMGLRRRFPRAEIVRDDSGLREEIRHLVDLIDQPARGCDLPLDLAGTPFQQQVWSALRSIPAGETVTYDALARSLGRPTAARAVARACASNPVAILVPCHRVLREDGGLGGYRWGIERKRILLERERGEGPNPTLFDVAAEPYRSPH